MKCGKDLDVVKVRESFFEVQEGESFTPQGSPDESSEQPARGPESGPGASGTDVSEILKAEYAKAAAADVEMFQEEESEVEPPALETASEERGQACEACGVVNPREQRFCKNCNSRLISQEPAGEERPASGGGGWDLEGLYDEHEYDGGYSDYAGDTPLAAEEPLVPLVETALFAPVSPSSDYYTSDTHARGRRKRSRGGKVVWRARDWLVLIVLTLVLSAGIWLFLLGGIDLFSGKVRNLKNAGRAMSKLASFEYSINGSMESPRAGAFKGSGTLRFESPDRSEWEFTTVVPDRLPVVARQIQISDKPYVNGGDAWAPADPATAQPDARELWSGVSSVEDLGQEPCGASANCHHYKYRIAPGTLTGMLGVWKPSGASDAVMEAWIDTSNQRVVRMTAQVFNVQLEGMRTSVSLTFDLAAVEQKYDIKAPI